MSVPGFVKRSRDTHWGLCLCCSSLLGSWLSCVRFGLGLGLLWSRGFLGSAGRFGSRLLRSSSSLLRCCLWLDFLLSLFGLLSFLSLWLGLLLWRCWFLLGWHLLGKLDGTGRAYGCQCRDQWLEQDVTYPLAAQIHLPSHLA